MTREDLIKASGIPNSGDLTVKLEELESCGFIRRYYAVGMKKKNPVESNQYAGGKCVDGTGV